MMLPQPVFLTDIIVEHLPRSASVNIGTAPKDFELWTKVIDKKLFSHARKLSSHVFQDESVPPSNMPESYVLVGKGTYDVDDSSHAQSFPVNVDLSVLGIAPEAIIFRWTSNHGNNDFSCIYRVRLSGEKAKLDYMEKRKRDFLADEQDGEFKGIGQDEVLI